MPLIITTIYMLTMYLCKASFHLLCFCTVSLIHRRSPTKGRRTPTPVSVKKIDPESQEK